MLDERTAGDEVREAPPHNHAVHVYADDLAITQELIRFIEAGLTLGEVVVVAATGRHSAAVAAWRSAHRSVGDNESLVVLDAAETLQQLMIEGMPDSGRFEPTIGATVDRAARGGRTVRVFGEMVALLWAEGNVSGALALESLWNDLALNRQFFLLCAYPEKCLDQASMRAVNAMCDQHSDLSLLGHQMQFADAVAATTSCTQRLLLPIPSSVSVARQIATRTLVDWQLPHLIESCVIVASELAANAVMHAESSFRLMFTRDESCLRIAVEDAVPDLPAAKKKPDKARRSGLGRVESIASLWGCDVMPDRKTVWAEVPV
jgi:MEDS: MEthanogen/methylotroph, DcmR Sensory domain